LKLIIILKEKYQASKQVTNNGDKDKILCIHLTLGGIQGKDHFFKNGTPYFPLHTFVSYLESFPKH